MRIFIKLVTTVKSGNNLVNTMEIKPFSVFWLNLAHILPKRRINPIDFLGLRSRTQQVKDCITLWTQQRSNHWLFWYNLAQMLPMISGWPVLIFMVIGQGHWLIGDARDATPCIVWLTKQSIFIKKFSKIYNSFFIGKNYRLEMKPKKRKHPFYEGGVVCLGGRYFPREGQ